MSPVRFLTEARRENGLSRSGAGARNADLRPNRHTTLTPKSDADTPRGVSQEKTQDSRPARPRQKVRFSKSAGVARLFRDEGDKLEPPARASTYARTVAHAGHGKAAEGEAEAQCGAAQGPSPAEGEGTELSVTALTHRARCEA